MHTNFFLPSILIGLRSDVNIKPREEKMEEVLMTVQEAATFMGVSYRAVLKWISEGSLGCYRIGEGRSIRIGSDHINRYLSEHDQAKEVVDAEPEKTEAPAGCQG